MKKEKIIDLKEKGKLDHVLKLLDIKEVLNMDIESHFKLQIGRLNDLQDELQGEYDIGNIGVDLFVKETLRLNKRIIQNHAITCKYRSHCNPS